jgi:hypothetical protein
MGQTSGIFEEENYANSSNSEGNYNVTAFVFFPSTSILRFQTGFKYFKVGYNVDFDVDFDGCTKVVASPNNVGREFSFVAIPLNLNHTLSFFNNAYVSGGLEVAYIVSAYSYKSHGMEPIRVDISDQYKDIYLFIALGLGFDIPLNQLTLFVKPEYTRSISNATESSSFGRASDIETLMLNIGLKF